MAAAASPVLQDIIFKDDFGEHTLDVDRHGGDQAPAAPVPKPEVRGNFDLDDAVVDALPIPGTKVISAYNYGMSLWGQTAKIYTVLPTGERKEYFLKAVSLGDDGRVMIEGEYESLKAIHAVSPDFGPEPYAWGKFRKEEESTYFLLAEYREVGEQPPNPLRFTARLAELHQTSVSPTGKFGFHITTCHAKLPQITDCWEESWEVLYRKQLGHMVKLDEQKHGEWPEFQAVARLVLEKVIPRLLRPLQSEGRSIKPCLVHGDMWDENAATNMDTGEPFVFDAGSFYAHNEYEIGNWRAPRHRLSDKVYVKNYRRFYPVSEPEDDWDDRNLLYSLRYDLGAAILIPGCNLRQIVKDGMATLCKKFCPKELIAATEQMPLPSSLDFPIDDDWAELEEYNEKAGNSYQVDLLISPVEAGLTDRFKDDECEKERAEKTTIETMEHNLESSNCSNQPRSHGRDEENVKAMLGGTMDQKVDERSGESVLLKTDQITTSKDNGEKKKQKKKKKKKKKKKQKQKRRKQGPTDKRAAGE
uniref:protein-ribulosamine 3-kinase n=1 Tax=Coccidioides posadasii RMSCC 3488 TaxID=454284 RepID=A0A0J6FI25_COCPO|nr:hypothetical protein CPAG_04816 [Coccidioides posadasii RMSCC 3488]